MTPTALSIISTAFRIGIALGVAIVTTVAVSRSEGYLAAHEDADPMVVLTEGFQSAFVACVVLAAIGVAVALLLLGRPRKAPHERLEPVPATGRLE
jgi:predicted MFS family arabinose efflux permease